MRIYTDAINFPLTEAIREHVEREVRSALRPIGKVVTRVTARLKDVNGDRGGEDKRCRVVAELNRGRTVIVEAVSRDLYAAVRKARARLRRAALRALKRPFARERDSQQRPGSFGEPLETGR